MPLRDYNAIYCKTLYVLKQYAVLNYKLSIEELAYLQHLH